MEPFKAGQKGSIGDAPQAQPDPRRADRRASPGCSAATPARRSRTSRSGTSATSATARAERVILPDATILLDYMLVRMAGLVEGLVVRGERMRENIERGLGLHASSRVLVALVERGGLSPRGRLRDRPARRAAAADERRPLRDLLAVDATVAAKLTPHRPRRLLRRPVVPPPRPHRHRPTRQPGGRSPCRPLARPPARSSAPARSATSTRSGRTGCCSSPRTGCRRSTSSCRPRSPTRAAC